jgi:hypothetical protein
VTFSESNKMYHGVQDEIRVNAVIQGDITRRYAKRFRSAALGAGGKKMSCEWTSTTRNGDIEHRAYLMAGDAICATRKTGCLDWGLGFGAWDLALGIWRLGFGIWDFQRWHPRCSLRRDVD